MSTITDAITKTAQSILPADATAAEVFNAVNVAISYHVATSLIEDAQFSKIVTGLGRKVEEYSDADAGNFTPDQTAAAVRALNAARRARAPFSIRA